MALTDIESLRQLLGEEIPVSGSETDTLFTNEQIQIFWDRANGDLDRAAFEGWRAKAAKLSNLVDTTEGNQQKKFSQLMDNALDMVKLYTRSSSSNGPTEGRARVGRLSRGPVPW